MQRQICLGIQAGIEKLVNLRVLWMSNNKVKDWAELDRLAANVRLEELLLIGNPLSPTPGSPEYRIEVHFHTPTICAQLSVPVKADSQQIASFMLQQSKHRARE